MNLVETAKLDRALYNAGLETDNEDEWVQDGACSDEECTRKDSAEIDHDDPINQGDDEYDRRRAGTQPEDVHDE